MLAKRVGNFEISFQMVGNGLIEKIENAKKEIGNIEDFYNNYENGYTNELLLVSYEYKDNRDYPEGGIGSTGLSITPFISEDEEVELSLNIYNELDSLIVYTMDFDVNDILNVTDTMDVKDCLYDALVANSKEFAEALYEYEY